MKLMTIASGSSGNSTFIGTDNTSILVDAGITRKRIQDNLHGIDMDLKDISGILITHEHIDHTKALGVISRSHNIPIYATKATCDAIVRTKTLQDMDSNLFVPIEPDKEFMIGDILIEAHSIWHDAVDPVCYTMKHQNKKISVATDIGNYDDYLVSALKDSDAMVVEANHDVNMLLVGPYPYDLKQRVLSDHGHLSNENSGKLIRTILNDHIKAICLGHLSKENNYPELAYETVKLELDGNPYTKDVRDFNLQVASRDVRSELMLI